MTLTPSPSTSRETAVGSQHCDPEAGYAVGDPGPAARARLIVVSGASGGGKSALLAEMARRGRRIFPEPGRQIVREQALIGGPGLPWVDLGRFAELALSRAMHFYNLGRQAGETVLFDRSVIDAVVALERVGAAERHHAEAARIYAYAPRVFMVPPWEALFAADAERRHGFDAACAEYEALLEGYAARGYEAVLVPRGSISARADFLEDAIRQRQPDAE